MGQLTVVHTRFRRAPLDISRRENAVIEVAVGEYTSMLGIPRPAKSAFVGNVQRIVGGEDLAGMDVDAVFVLVCGVGSLDCQSLSIERSCGVMVIPSML